MAWSEFPLSRVLERCRVYLYRKESTQLHFRTKSFLLIDVTFSMKRDKKMEL